MVMNNDGSGNIYRNDSLKHPHEWSTKLKERIAKALNIKERDIKNPQSIEFFDVIVTNPPFGSKIPIKDPHVLEQYNLGYIWRNKEGWLMSPKLQTSVPPEQLFIERCLQFLKPGGRLAIVLPDSILGNPGLTYIRQWLVETTKIVASIDLHVDTFQPRNGTQTSLLLLQKKTLEEIQQEQKTRTMKPYSVFMAMVEKIGHDKRGNTLFKRDEQGNEIWVPEEPNVFEISKNVKDEVMYKAISKTRIIDDQSKEVAPVFNKWKKEEGVSW